MKDIVLHAKKREKDQSAKEVRNEKMVPAVVYGDKKENIPLMIEASELLRVFRKAGESHIIVLDVEGEKIDVLIQDYQRHHITGEFTHMDFYAVTVGQTLNTTIKLDFIGKSQAEIDGAILEEHIKEIDVTVLPKDLVDSFEVDLSALKETGDAIRISDLNIDKEVFDHTHNDEDIVVIASEPAKVEVEEEAPEFEVAEVVGSDDENSENSEEK